MRKNLYVNMLAFAWQHWRRNIGGLIAFTVVMLLSLAADVAAPVMAGKLIDVMSQSTAAGIPDDRFGIAMGPLGLFVGLAFVYFAFRYLAFIALIWLTGRIMESIVAEAFEQVQRFSAQWHNDAFAGATVRKITRGMWAFDQFADTILLGLVPSFIVLSGASVVLFAHWPEMGLLVAALSGVFIAVSVYLSAVVVAPVFVESNAADSRLGGALSDAIGNNAAVKAFGAEAREEARFRAIAAEWRTLTQRAWRRSTNTAFLGQSAMLVLFKAAVLGLAAWLWSEGRASPGEVVYVVTTTLMIVSYLREVGMHVRNLQRSANEMEDVVAFAGEPLGVPDQTGAPELDVPQGRIVFDRVTFRYGGQSRPIYDHFTLAIKPGEKIGLVGASGSGKSTFVKLLQRLYDVNDGAILIDGQDVRAVSQRSLRAAIGMVPQEPALFHRTIAENIAYGAPGATEADIAAAAREAHADGFIARLPEGLNTLVGERGVKLSGGERQRIAIARAILANRPILVLDEATSSLDSESEVLIQDAIERLIANRTTIVIAHRLSTIQKMDRILVFDNGRIVEQGTHAELIARPNGAYRRLWSLQSGAEAATIAA